MKNRKEEGEKLFQKGYGLLQKETPDALITNGAFLKPLEKAAKDNNPKALFILGYFSYIGYKNLTVNQAKGQKVLKRAYPMLLDAANKEHDYQAAKFLSEYYRVPLAGHVKDDAKVSSYLAMSDSFRDTAQTQKISSFEGEFEPASKNSPEKAKSPDGTSAYDQLVNAIADLKEDGTFDSKEKLEIIKTSADNGNMRAALFLGEAYIEGKYVPKDLDSALLYLRLAESQGSIKAKFLLGKLLVEGNFSRSDVVKGLNSIYLAAKAGLSEAQFYLGKVYFEGKAVEKDYAKSFLYFQAAYTRGDERAASYLKDIEAEKGDRLLVAKSQERI